jgi:aminoglycoside phosphotransferase (APT) family kinase protein
MTGAVESRVATSSRMHEGQLDVDTGVVAELVAEQFPQWEGLPIRKAPGTGTVNAVFRLGDAWAVRLPLVVDDPDAALKTLRREADAAREFARSTTVPAPVTVAIGSPGARYPGPWCVTTWIDGGPGTAGGFAHSTPLALDLATLILDLRAVPVGGRSFAGAGRGGELRAHDDWMATCLDRSEGLLDVAALRRAWAVFRDLPRRSPDAMSHTDLIPANLLVSGGRLAGVLDVGGFQPADPALDLVVAWHVFDEPSRSELRAALRRQSPWAPEDEELEWARGAAWAFEQAMGLVWYYRESNPAMSELGASTLRRIMASGVLDGH